MRRELGGVTEVEEPTSGTEGGDGDGLCDFSSSARTRGTECSSEQAQRGVSLQDTELSHGSCCYSRSWMLKVCWARGKAGQFNDSETILRGNSGSEAAGRTKRCWEHFAALFLHSS